MYTKLDRKPYVRPDLSPKIKNSGNVYKNLTEYKDKDKEHFVLLTLDIASRIINTHLISIGTINQSIVHPREVFRPAIADNAAGIIVAHNHPSGELEASQQDLDITKRLRECGTLIGIELLDHVILTSDDYLSLRDEGIIND